MAGDVTAATPRQFAAMLAAFPGLTRIEMIDCPGSLDEEANLALARAIRRAGLETVVPSGGSVRSGAVELWLERSEEHTSELQSLMRISYAVFCLKKKKNNKIKY